MVYRFQSTAESPRLRVHGTAGGSEALVHSDGGFSAGQRVAILILAGYKKLISPLLPSACRYYPTCSCYMREAIEVHGTAKGFWLGLKRLGRCHPFHEGGMDPVPTKE